MSVTGLNAAARAYARAAAARQEARDRLAEQVRVAVAGGMSESEAAREAGVARETVRSWLGKG